MFLVLVTTASCAEFKGILNRLQSDHNIAQPEQPNVISSDDKTLKNEFLPPFFEGESSEDRLHVHLPPRDPDESSFDHRPLANGEFSPLFDDAFSEVHNDVTKRYFGNSFPVLNSFNAPPKVNQVNPDGDIFPSSESKFNDLIFQQDRDRKPFVTPHNPHQNGVLNVQKPSNQPELFSPFGYERYPADQTKVSNVQKTLNQPELFSPFGYERNRADPNTKSAVFPFGYGPPLIRSSAFQFTEPERDIISSPSPYWADPEGRPAPRPPLVDPNLLRNTRLPCSLLNSSSPQCDPSSPYRSMDGSCNNLRSPHLGRTNTVLQRLLPFSHDVSHMRRLSVLGGLLPNPRLISNKLDKLRPHASHAPFNLLFVFFGQFIDHDLVSVPFAEDPASRGINLVCRHCESWRSHAACAPIPVPSGDPFFKGGPACLPFTRSVGLPVRSKSGEVYSENINMNTAYLDLSSVYGSHSCLTGRLRAYSGGRLLASHVSGGSYPLLTPAEHFAICRTKFKQCHLSGDERSNEHLGLLALHTIFMREHNRIADKLVLLNPAWDDEKLFQVRSLGR